MIYINSENSKPETKVFRYMDLAKFLSLIHQKAIFFLLRLVVMKIVLRVCLLS